MTPTSRALAVLAFTVFATACGGGGSNAPTKEAAAPLTNPVDPATAGAVTGHVTFSGQAPAPTPISMASDPRCPNTGATAQPVMVGANGSLQNAFVYVKDGLGNLKFPVPTTPVVLDQSGCQYSPHVFGVQVGQTVEILNSDPTLHNIHAIPGTNQEFNTAQPMQNMKTEHVFTAKEDKVVIPFKCDVHGWMNAYAGVLDHPYFAVTGEDGKFSIKNLPPGTYKLTAWHEKAGTKTIDVTVAAKETKEDANFSFAAPAGAN